MARDDSRKTTSKPLIKITVLLDRLALAQVPTLDVMARELGVDWYDLAKATHEATQIIRHEQDPLEVAKATMGLVAWGVAIGFFYAKSEAPIVTPRIKVN
jgi:hypothetical protein